MARLSYGSRAGRVRSRATPAQSGTDKTPEELVREMKAAGQKPAGEDYRERSLAIHGLVCARCGREFNSKNRHLLTVHHKDGNHHNNPPDGSNWENLCVYCHDDAHGRGELGQYIGGAAGETSTMVHGEEGGGGALGDALRKALEKKGSKG